MMSELQRLNVLLAAQRLTQFSAVIDAGVVEPTPGKHPIIVLRVDENALYTRNSLPSHATLREMPPALAELDVVLDPRPPNKACVCRN
jgi:hypothetical protein